MFAIETKYWSGRVTLDGGKILVNGREPSRPPLETLICNVSELNALLTGGEGHLTEDELERIVKSLEQKEEA